MQADRHKKDVWDKIGSLSGIFATTLIAIVGLYFTDKYETANLDRNLALDKQNQIMADNQARLRELEAVEKLLPHLSGKDTDPTRQKLTILALRELGNPELAIQFAEILGTEGSIAALKYTANTAESKEEREAAEKALGRLTLGGGGSVQNPELAQIIKAISTLQGQLDSFLIFEKQEQHYMQTIGGPDNFTLEYRDGSKDRHYQCKASRNMVIQAFQAYAQDDDSWRKICDWEKLRLP